MGCNDLHKITQLLQSFIQHILIITSMAHAFRLRISYLFFVRKAALLSCACVCAVFTTWSDFSWLGQIADFFFKLVKIWSAFPQKCQIFLFFLSQNLFFYLISCCALHYQALSVITCCFSELKAWRSHLIALVKDVYVNLK